MDTRIDLQLLDRYLAGEATAEERADVEQWLGAAPRRSLELLVTQREHGYPERLGDGAEMWARLSPSIGIDDRAGKPAPERTLERRPKRTHVRTAKFDVPNPLGSGWAGGESSRNQRRVGWAAAVVGVVGAALLLMVAPPKSNDAPAIAASRPTIYTTRPAQRANVSLADGTRVTLAPATTISISGRTVTLQGQASFKVEHQTATPFAVIANGTRTTVLGTEFVVRAYPGEGETRVVVRAGRVEVQPATITSAGARVLDARMRMTIAANGMTDVDRNADIAADFGWTYGRLILRDATVGEALPQLARWYDIDVRVADSALLARHITTTLPSALSDEKLSVLAAAIGARVVRSGRVVMFVPL